MQGTVTADETKTFPEFLDRAYPDIERGEGVWLCTTDGRKILDACSGGAMVSCLGSGVQPVIDAAAKQAGILPYYYDEQFTNEPKEELAKRLIAVAAPEMGRVRFVSSGSEANEMALRLARAYHVDRGQPDRWQVISPAQSYHGATMATIALSGRPSIQGPYGPYLSAHPHIPPATWRFDATGETALKELDRALQDLGPETVSAFFIEPVSALSLPAYSPPEKFWEGLAERRDRYGFLVVFDEVVTGMGRTGRWFAYQQLPLVPDIVTTGKGLGAGYFPVGAVLCRQEVYDALAASSRSFDLGHTWDGAPLSCAVGLAVLDVLSQRNLVERVRDRGPALRDELASALSGSDFVHDVRGRGFLLGVELVDPRDGSSFLPADLHAAYLVEDQAFENGLLVRGTHSGSDEYTRDEVLLAPPYTSSDEDLATMVERFAQTISQVERSIKESLAGTPVGV
ncbi:MAG TPA: aminotransferase class III-fold pyridoxal phosphate-dependent enzyme [Chloroflexota bacterium]|nr:aminotransferase class III-fold pyridoxal phosphate-dependent enzyme [Chloroflexota bacterium]